MATIPQTRYSSRLAAMGPAGPQPLRGPDGDIGGSFYGQQRGPASQSGVLPSPTDGGLQRPVGGVIMDGQYTNWAGDMFNPDGTPVGIPTHQQGYAKTSQPTLMPQGGPAPSQEVLNRSLGEAGPAQPGSTTPAFYPDISSQLDPNVLGAQYGLSGAEQAFRGGALAGVDALQTGSNQARIGLGNINQLAGQQIQAGMNQLGGNFGATASSVNPLTGRSMFQDAARGVGAYSPEGLRAQQMAAALSGSQGQEAFDEAFLNSPVQAFLREQGERSVINQAAATGGLQGGNVLRELQRVGQGIAGQQLQQQVSNLMGLSGQGLQAAGQRGQFLSQAGQQEGNLAAQNAQLQTQAALQSASNRLSAARGRADLAGRQAGITAQLGSQGAGISDALGRNVANLLSGSAGQIGSARLQAGRDLASQIGQTTGALSGLAQQQGAGIADIYGTGALNVANTLKAAGLTDAEILQSLGTAYSNLATGTATPQANIALRQGNVGAQTALAQGQNISNLVGNLAGAYGMYQGMQTPPPPATSGAAQANIATPTQIASVLSP